MTGLELYDLDITCQRRIARVIANTFKKNGVKRVPLVEADFIRGYNDFCVATAVKEVADSAGLEVDCTPQEAYKFYDYLMR